VSAASEEESKEKRVGSKKQKSESRRVAISVGFREQKESIHHTKKPKKKKNVHTPAVVGRTEKIVVMAVNERKSQRVVIIERDLT